MFRMSIARSDTRRASPHHAHVHFLEAVRDREQRGVERLLFDFRDLERNIGAGLHFERKNVSGKSPRPRRSCLVAAAPRAAPHAQWRPGHRERAESLGGANVHLAAVVVRDEQMLAFVAGNSLLLAGPPDAPLL